MNRGLLWVLLLTLALSAWLAMEDDGLGPRPAASLPGSGGLTAGQAGSPARPGSGQAVIARPVGPALGPAGQALDARLALEWLERAESRSERAWPKVSPAAMRAWGAAPQVRSSDPPPATPLAAAASAAHAQRKPPPMPYRAFGQLDDGVQAHLLLAVGPGALAVAVGDVVDGQWRLDALTPQGARWRHLPTGEAMQSP